MCIFFFQAEDGIRDLVRSRGLGDVYKRQPVYGIAVQKNFGDLVIGTYGRGFYILDDLTPIRAVSYTHLTLPTSDLV